MCVRVGDACIHYPAGSDSRRLGDEWIKGKLADWARWVRAHLINIAMSHNSTQQPCLLPFCAIPFDIVCLSFVALFFFSCFVFHSRKVERK